MTTRPGNSRLVNWIGYIGVTLLLALAVSVLTVRSGAWQQGLLLYALSCAGAAILLALSLLLMILPRYIPWRRAIGQRAVLAVPGTLLLLTALGSRGDYPAIHDVTTDTADPPVFSAAPGLRGTAANTLDIIPETVESQKQAYPGLRTIHSQAPIEAAYQQALATAKEMGWEIYREDLNGGYIEAVDTTAIMGFKDDIVIRLRTNADGTLIDLRSVSRVGISDMGANASRIRDFTSQLTR